MLRSVAKYVSMTALAAACAFPALAQSGVNDVVTDHRGAPVTDHRNQCVITKWMVNQNNCGEFAAREARSYLVFFDFNRYTITQEAARILYTLAEENKSVKVKHIDVIGHADRSGSVKYNMALSKKRANAVKNALVKIGFPAQIISTRAKGESEPLVPTRDGIREPQNRRAEIVVHTK